MSSGWSRNDFFQLAGVVLAIIAIVTSITNPEVRRLLGFDALPAPSIPSPDSSVSSIENSFELPSEEEPSQESPGRLSKEHFIPLWRRLDQCNIR